MSDERVAFERLLASVPPPSADAWTRGRGAWDATAPALGAVEVPARSRHLPAFSWRSAMALVASIAVVVVGVAVVRARLRSVEPTHTVNGLSLEGGSGTTETFLVVGNDRRDLLGADDTPSDRGRADTIAIVQVDPETDSVAMLSVPRDLFVVTGGGPVRLAQLFASQGPQQFVAAIRDTLHVAIDHYVEVDFEGFAALVDEVGGVRLQFPTAQRDRETGLDEQPGCRTLDGNDALAFVRSRHLQFEKDGVWQYDGSADLGRVQRAQMVMGALANVALGNMPVDPAPTVRKFFSHVTVDTSFTVDDALTLLRAMRGAPMHVTSGTLPVSRTFLAIQDGFVLSPDAAAAFGDMLTGSPLPADSSIATDPLALATAC
jgi:LCP family protein required for cell wall assembly